MLVGGWEPARNDVRGLYSTHCLLDYMQQVITLCTQYRFTLWTGSLLLPLLFITSGGKKL